MTRFMVLTALLLMLAIPAAAQEITADRFVVNEGAREATFSGNVVVKQPDLTVWADTVIVHYGDAGASSLEDFEAVGNVRIKQPEQSASGNRALYNPGTKILRLTGNVVVTNASGTVRGPELIVDLANRTTQFGGAGNGGRVTGIFTPQGSSSQ